MTDHLASKTEALRALHVPGQPLLLPNAWDVASARDVVDEGLAAVATSSAAVARSLGHDDHEDMSPETAFDAVARITGAVDVPVTADIEAGYGLEPREIVERLIAAGAAGCNLEDTDHATGGVRDIAASVDRIAAFREAATASGVPLVLNARIDLFARAGSPDDLSVLDDALERGRAYRAAGADCVYPILLADDAAVGRFVEACAVVNVLLRPGAPTPSRLAELGAARISLGSGLHTAARRYTRRAVAALLAGDTSVVFDGA